LYLATLVPLVSGANNPEDYELDQLEYKTDLIKNIKNGKVIEFPPVGPMKILIQNGQNSLEDSGGSFCTYSFKGWKVITLKFKVMAWLLVQVGGKYTCI